MGDKPFAPPSLPFPEEQMLRTIRQGLASRLSATEIRLPWRISACAALHDGLGGGLGGYRVTVLVDPQLGIPAGQPGTEPFWAAATVLVVTLSADGVLRADSPGEPKTP